MTPTTLLTELTLELISSQEIKYDEIRFATSFQVHIVCMSFHIVAVFISTFALTETCQGLFKHSGNSIEILNPLHCHTCCIGIFWVEWFWNLCCWSRLAYVGDQGSHGCLYRSLLIDTMDIYMGDSKNSGFSPQIIHFTIRFCLINHPFWGYHHI